MCTHWLLCTTSYHFLIIIIVIEVPALQIRQSFQSPRRQSRANLIALHISINTNDENILRLSRKCRVVVQVSRRSIKFWHAHNAISRANRPVSSAFSQGFTEAPSDYASWHLHLRHRSLHRRLIYSVAMTIVHSWFSPRSSWWPR